MSTTTTEAAPEGAQTAGARGLVLYAVIKSSSKYAYQGREGRKPVALRVTWLEERTDYAFHLENGNRYRREDLTFYVREGAAGSFVKLR